MELNLRRKSHPMSAEKRSPGYVASPTRYLRHRVTQHDTVFAISLKYDVSVEQLKRENKLWSNDALILREFLLVPLTNENSNCVPEGSEIVRAASLKSDSTTDPLRSSSSSNHHHHHHHHNSSGNGPTTPCTEECVTEGGGQSSTSAPDLSAKDFLYKYDSSFAQLKSNVQRMEESTSLQNVCWSAEHSPPPPQDRHHHHHHHNTNTTATTDYHGDSNTTTPSSSLRPPPPPPPPPSSSSSSSSSTSSSSQKKTSSRSGSGSGSRSRPGSGSEVTGGGGGGGGAGGNKLFPKSLSFDSGDCSPVLVIRSRTKQVKKSALDISAEQSSNELFQL